MLSIIALYFVVSLLIAAPFLARYAIVSLRERMSGSEQGFHHVAGVAGQRLFQRF